MIIDDFEVIKTPIKDVSHSKSLQVCNDT